MAATGEKAFRRWLIDRIKQTRFSLLLDQDAERLAAGMGVRPEVLVEAQREKEAELAKLGRVFAHTQSDRRWASDSHRAVSLWCPASIRADINDRAARMESTASELVRGVIHTLLSGPDNPVYLVPHWRYQDQIWRRIRGERHDVRVRLTAGAYSALQQRAQRLSASTMALVRAAVADYLEGRMQGAYYVLTGEMWEDPSRYWTGELTRKGEYRGHTGTAQT